MGLWVIGYGIVQASAPALIAIALWREVAHPGLAQAAASEGAGLIHPLQQHGYREADGSAGRLEELIEGVVLKLLAIRSSPRQPLAWLNQGPRLPEAMHSA